MVAPQLVSCTVTPASPPSVPSATPLWAVPSPMPLSTSTRPASVGPAKLLVKVQTSWVPMRTLLPGMTRVRPSLMVPITAPTGLPVDAALISSQAAETRLQPGSRVSATEVVAPTSVSGTDTPLAAVPGVLVVTV